MAKPLDSKWSELSDKQKAKYDDKAAFKEAKQARETRMAGKALKQEEKAARQAEQKAYMDSDNDFLDVNRQIIATPSIDQDRLGASIEKRAGKIERLSGREGKEDKVAKLTAKNEKRQRQYDARAAFDPSGGIDQYDPSAFGGSRFSAKDISFLESQGYGKQEISDYVNTFDKSKVHGSAQVLDGYDIHREGSRDADGNFNSSQFGLRENHYNDKDLRALSAEGKTEREQARTMYDQMEDTTRSRKAQALLDKYIGEFRTTDTSPDPVDETPIDTTDPIDETPVDTTPDPIDTDPGTGNETPDIDNGNDSVIDIPDNEQTTDVIGGGEGSSNAIISNSGNTTITDSFNGGTVNISGEINAAGDVGIDNSNNSRYYGGDNNQSAINYGGGSQPISGEIESPSEPEQAAQDLLQSNLDAITGGSTAGVADSANTDIDNSFNGGNVDISGDITAGGNVDIDNSNNSRYYGGDNTQIAINYGEGANRLNTTPLSDLTMLGYGKPSDSPSAQAQFTDMYQTLNQDSQKKYKDTGVNTAYKYIANAAATNPIDYVALNQQVAQGIQNHYDRAAAQEAIYMGDKYNYRPPQYNFPDPLKPITSDAADIADSYRDEINGDDDDD